MAWKVLFHEKFETEFYELHQTVQDELLAYAKLLEFQGQVLILKDLMLIHSMVPVMKI